MKLVRWAMTAIGVLGLVIAATAAQDPGAGGRGAQRGGGPPAGGQRGGGGGGPAMTLTTTAFADGGQIPAKYTQAGDQVSPALAWHNAPANTAGFVLHMHDMEGVRNRTTDDQLHWLVWTIPGSATGLPEGVPQGAQLPDGSWQVSASGQMYRGPGAPANGPMHHYTFEIFALDTRIDVPPAADAFETRTNVMKAMQGHILGKAVLMGLFHRPQ
jgi:Raf kinase inhibitor-like YbhB/YbcL family protein